MEIKEWWNPGNAFSDPAPVRPRGLSFITVPLMLVVLMWTIYWLDVRHGLELYHWGVLPRTWEGLRGVLMSPLLHGGTRHLLNNSLPILVLGSVLYFFYPRRATGVLLFSWLISGLLTWVIARDNFHIGASSLVYALAAFVFFSGVFRGQARLLAISLLVAFLYGGLVWGLLPVEPQVSHEAHLAGGISGVLLAFLLRKVPPAVKAEKQQQALQRQAKLDDLSREEARFGPQYWLPPEQRSQSWPEAPQGSRRIAYHYKLSSASREQSDPRQKD